MKKITILIAAVAFSACQSDWHDGIAPQWSNEEIALTTSVSSSRQATRADGTIINKGETTLLPTEISGQYVGIFGAYTGQHTWSDLVTLAAKENPTTDETATLKKHYSANQMFNVQATIGNDGTLTYTPLRFWPNNVIPSQTNHEYMTFWAYYPWNATSSMGTYGISMTSDEMGEGKGMGRVRFTMHPDASQQNDFLISAPVTDCNRDKYPLLRTDHPYTNTPAYAPKPVQLKLYHMLAQVRFYVFIRGDDKMVYLPDVATDADLLLDNDNIKQMDLDDDGDNEPAIKNELGEWVELKVGDKIPDESQCVRWQRSEIYNLSHTSKRPNITYTMQLNNIKTSATFYPNYSGGSATIDVDEATTLGSATINHYIMNPYWFTFRNGLRERLNDNYMFGYYEDTPVAKELDATTSMTGYDDIDGWNWTGLTDPLDYLGSYLSELTVMGQHYNFAPGNILLVVPQTLSDDQVPHVVITAHGKTTQGTAEPIDNTAKVTINMLKMGISWESGYIYCYAFLDDLCPGDDKVRGPESITTIFNSNWYTDQW